MQFAYFASFHILPAWLLLPLPSEWLPVGPATAVALSGLLVFVRFRSFVATVSVGVLSPHCASNRTPSRRDGEKKQVERREKKEKRKKKLVST